MVTGAKRKLVIGTRGSRLALWQANHVKKLIEDEYRDIVVTLKIIKTSGDKILNVPLADIGGKALFLKEIEDQILEEKVHFGVHSMKDVPAVLPKGLSIVSILKREDPRDVFISKKYGSLLQLPKKAKIGTSSLRRQSQLKNFRPDIEVVPLRGNVETRLRKLSSGEMGAIILAAAGMTRLGMSSKITEYLDTSLMLPSVGQGAIGIEIRDIDHETRRLLEFLNHIETAVCVRAERSFMKTLDGDCQAPVAGFAVVDGQTIKMAGMVASPDGRELFRSQEDGSIRDPEAIGEKLAKVLLAQGAKDILASCRKKHP
jgi:hydroxymethylbilane synthase